MTATRSEDASVPLPLWRLIAGFGVLGILVTLLIVAGAIYVENFRLDRSVRAFVSEPASASLSDSALTDRVLQRAKQLDLPVKASDITVTHANGGARIQIAKYLVETSVVRMALRMPSASFQVK